MPNGCVLVPVNPSTAKEAPGEDDVLFKKYPAFPPAKAPPPVALETEVVINIRPPFPPLPKYDPQAPPPVAL